MQQPDTSLEYAPGTCNIGKEEIRRRYRIGYLGLAGAVILVAFIELTDLPPIWKLSIFIPVFYSLSGFIQAWKKFCYVYGFKGVTSLSGRKKFARVKDAQFLREDRKTVFNLVLLILLGSLLVTGAYYFLTV